MRASDGTRIILKIAGSGTDTVSLAEEIADYRSAIGSTPFPAVSRLLARAQFWLVTVQWAASGVSELDIIIGAVAAASLPVDDGENDYSYSRAVTWDSIGNRRYFGYSDTSEGGPCFTDGNSARLVSETSQPYWEDRLAFKLEYGCLSLKVLQSGATDSIQLPAACCGSKEWRPFVSMMHPCKITLGLLPSSEKF